MRPKDIVAGVVVAGQARAYPWWIMRNYHIANDTIPLGEGMRADPEWSRWVRELEPRGLTGTAYVPLLITFCEACSGAAAFIPTVDGSLDSPLVFAQCKRARRWTGDWDAIGVYTMCDLQTQSRWHPFSGRAASGRLRGERLTRVPIALEYWRTWRRLHPDTLVVLGAHELRHRTHATLASGRVGHPGVHPSFARMLERDPAREDKRLPRHALVLGVADPDGGAALAYPLAALRKRGGVAEREVGGEPFVLILRGSYRARAFSRRLDGGVLRLRALPGPPFRLQDESGTIWNELGVAVSGTHAGRALTAAPDSYLTEWSDWSMEHPGSEIASD
jgi:hypothetical protein